MWVLLWRWFRLLVPVLGAQFAIQAGIEYLWLDRTWHMGRMWFNLALVSFVMMLIVIWVSRIKRGWVYILTFIILFYVLQIQRQLLEPIITNAAIRWPINQQLAYCGVVMVMALIIATRVESLYQDTEEVIFG